jgi:uncharacterized protein (DUF305 family)
VIPCLVTAACATAPTGGTGREPGDTQVPAPAPAPATSGTAPGSIPYTRADVSFMQGMILHHAQALEMTRLVPDRTKSRDLGLLARRISESQDYEIDLMGRWLARRGESVPEIGNSGAATHDGMAGMGTMAGMATPEQMARLADSKDVDFERLFLELMIRHHEGALTMLDDLGKHEGAGQEPELFQLISHVDADQRAEIARMRRMLNELQ